MEYTNYNTSVGVENQLPTQMLDNLNISSSKNHKNQKNSEKHKINKNNVLDDKAIETQNTLLTANNEEHTTNLQIINQNNTNTEFLIDYLKIGSINIQTAYNTKLNDIINYFVTHNFDILGLTETGLYGHQTNTIIKHHQHPTLLNNLIHIIHDSSGPNKGSGVAIMLTDKIYRHLHHTTFFEGRILNLILGFRKSKQFNITCTYLPSSPNNNKEKTSTSIKCSTKMKEIITNSQKNKNTYAIIIGDFNCSPKQKSNINYSFIRLLKENNYKDMIKHHQDDMDNNLTHLSTRIDYHFGNTLLLDQSIHSFTQSIPSSFFTTDHKIVITLLEKTFFDSKKHRLFDKFNNTPIFPKHSIKILEYEKMIIESWATYTNRSRTIFKKRFSKLSTSINTETALNDQ